MISNISEVYCTVLVSYSGILFLYIRTCFIYQAALVVIYMVLYWSTFSLMFLIHFFLYYCIGRKTSLLMNTFIDMQQYLQLLSKQRFVV